MRIIHVLTFILWVFTEVVFSQVNTTPEIKLTRDQINYIYNRAFELLLIDRHANNLDMSEGLPFNKDLIPFDSIRFYINSKRIGIKENSDDPYHLDNARALNAEFDLHESSMFSLYKANLIELETEGNFDYIGSSLPGVSNIALVSFSDLYTANNYIYIRLQMIYLLKGQFYYFPSACTFQIELCNDRIPIFKVGFYNGGMSDIGHPNLIVFNFNEIDCK